jgi:hypothetical protein
LFPSSSLGTRRVAETSEQTSVPKPELGNKERD